MTKEELAANATDQVIEIFGRMPPDAVCERITEAIAAAIDAAVSAKQERLVALVTEYGVQPSLIAGIRSRDPAPERPCDGTCHNGSYPCPKPAPVDPAPERTCKCAKYGVGACDIHGPRCCIHCGRNGCSCSKPAPVDPVREALRKYLFNASHRGYCAWHEGLECTCGYEVIALALEKTEAEPHG